MKLSYCKYLKCFCGSELHNAYGFQNGEFKPLDANQDTVVETGMVAGGSGANGDTANKIGTYTKADAAPDRSAESFFRKHSTCLPKGIKIPSFARAHDVSDPVAENKKKEMKARDEQADKYHTYLVQAYASNEQKFFSRFPHPAASDIIVELGCGTGKITCEIIKAGFKDLIAMDFSEASIRLLLEKLDERTKNRILFIKADACNLPLKSQISDKCVSAQVFEHIPGMQEQEKFIIELRRILKPSGIATMTVYNLNIRKKLQKAAKGYHEGSIYFENFTKKEIKKVFERHFTIDQLFGINCYFPFFYKTGPSFQHFMEKILSKSPLNSFLGNILFLSLKSRKEPIKLPTKE